MACADKGCLWWCVGAEWIPLEVGCDPGCDCTTPTLVCSSTENQNAKITFPCEGAGDPTPDPTPCDSGQSAWRCLGGVWELVDHTCTVDCVPTEPVVACVEDTLAAGGCGVAAADESSSASTACDGDCPEDDWRRTAELTPGDLSAPEAGPCGGLCDVPDHPSGVADTYTLTVPVPTLEAYAELAGDWELTDAGEVDGYRQWRTGTTAPYWTLIYRNDSPETATWSLTGVTASLEEVSFLLSETFDPCSLSAFAYATHTLLETVWSYPLAVGTTPDGPCECCDDSSDSSADDGTDGGDDADCRAAFSVLRTYECVSFRVPTTDNQDVDGLVTITGAWDNAVGGWVADTTFPTVDGATTATLFKTVSDWYVRLEGETRTWYAHEVACQGGCRVFAADVDPSKDTGSGFPEESSDDDAVCADHSFRIRVCCASCDVSVPCCPNPIPRNLCVTFTPPCCDEVRVFNLRYSPLFLISPQSNPGSGDYIEGWVSDWQPPLWCGVDDFAPLVGESTSRRSNARILGWRYVFYCTGSSFLGIVQVYIEPCPNNAIFATVSRIGVEFNCETATGSGTDGFPTLNNPEYSPCEDMTGATMTIAPSGCSGMAEILPVPDPVGYCDCEHCPNGSAYEWVVDISELEIYHFHALPNEALEGTHVTSVTLRRFRTDAFLCMWTGCVTGSRVHGDTITNAAVEISDSNIKFYGITGSCYYAKDAPLSCCGDNTLSLVRYTSVPPWHPFYCDGDGLPETITLRAVGVCDDCDGSDSGSDVGTPTRYACVDGVCTEVEGGPYTSTLCGGNCDPTPPPDNYFCYITISTSGTCISQFNTPGTQGCLFNAMFPDVTGPGIYNGICPGDGTYTIIVGTQVTDCDECASQGSDSGSDSESDAGSSSGTSTCCGDCIVPYESTATIQIVGGDGAGSFDVIWVESVPGVLLAGPIPTGTGTTYIKVFCAGDVWLACWGADLTADDYCWTSYDVDCSAPVMSVAFDNAGTSPPESYGPDGTSENPVTSIVLTTTCASGSDPEFSDSASGPPPPP